MVEGERVYLDFAATTPLNKQVLSAMLPYFFEDFGNPSSVHTWGQNSEAAIETARETLAKLLHANTDQVVFTSGGTESDNLAIRGGAHHAQKLRKASHILISPVEHPAVAQTAMNLHDEGFEIEWLPVDRFGMVDPEDVRSRITKNTALVSVIYGQNEIGTINPIDEIARVCNEREVFFHSDGVQAFAHLEIDLTGKQETKFCNGCAQVLWPKRGRCVNI